MATRKILAIIIALALVLGMAVCLSGCKKTTKIDVTDNENVCLIPISKQRIEVANGYHSQLVLYDPETLVMYVYISDAFGASITTLYNADGNPKLYNPENN